MTSVTRFQSGESPSRVIIIFNSFILSLRSSVLWSIPWVSSWTLIIAAIVSHRSKRHRSLVLLDGRLCLTSVNGGACGSTHLLCGLLTGMLTISSSCGSSGGCCGCAIPANSEVTMCATTCCDLGLILTPTQLTSGSTDLILLWFQWLVFLVGSCNTVITLPQTCMIV